MDEFWKFIYAVLGYRKWCWDSHNCGNTSINPYPHQSLIDTTQNKISIKFLHVIWTNHPIDPFHRGSQCSLYDIYGMLSQLARNNRHSYPLSVAISLLLLNYNAVLAQFTISVPSLEVAIGQTFPVSWTATSDEPQAVDICLNTDTEFIPVGSIQRNDLLAGTVNITLADTISPT